MNRRLAFCALLFAVSVSASAQELVPVPMCDVSIEEVPAGDIGPDIGSGFWVEEYTLTTPPDPLVNIGVCKGMCINPAALPDMKCVPTKFKPIRIEHHGPDGVTPLRVFVPAECNCQVHPGPVIVWFYVNPFLDPRLTVFVVQMSSDSGTGSAFAGILMSKIARIASFLDAPASYREANAGAIPLTPQLKDAIERWTWARFGEAVLSSAGDAGLSEDETAILVARLSNDFPGLWE
jgi:hypothetical protein